MHILTIDGGGIRGIFAAHVLKRIQEEFKINFTEYFDLIAGTSTGSIIAAGLAVNYPIDKIVALYQEISPLIFKKRILHRLGLLASRYKNKELREKLNEAFKDQTLSDTETKLLIPATNIGTGNVFVFKSKYSSDFVRDNKIKIQDAVLASCAAPTFFDPYRVNEYLLSDGGLWANNPTLIAVIEALTRLEKNINELKILSIGTGNSRKYYSMRKSILGWGMLTRWKHKQFFELVLNLQSQNAQNISSLLLKENQLLRINFDSDKRLPLDDIRQMDDLKSRADEKFTYHSRTLKEFLESSS